MVSCFIFNVVGAINEVEYIVSAVGKFVGNSFPNQSVVYQKTGSCEPPLPITRTSVRLTHKLAIRLRPLLNHDPARPVCAYRRHLVALPRLDHDDHAGTQGDSRALYL